MVGPMALVALFAIGCTDSSSSPIGPDQGLAAITATPGQPDLGEFELCKVGPQSIFRAIVDGTGQPRFRLGPDACIVIATTAQLGPGNHTVTVIEDVLTGSGQVLDSIVSTTIFHNIPVRGAPLTGTNQVTQTFNGDRGWLVQFYNH
jgi:hypothetical protein